MELGASDTYEAALFELWRTLLDDWKLVERVELTLLSESLVVLAKNPDREAIEYLFSGARAAVRLGIHELEFDAGWLDLEVLRSSVDFGRAWLLGELWAQEERVDGRVLRSRLMHESHRGGDRRPSLVHEQAGDSRWTDAFRRKQLVDRRSGLDLSSSEFDRDAHRAPWAPWAGSAGPKIVETISRAMGEIGSELSLDSAARALPVDGALDLHNFHPKEVKRLVLAYIDECREMGQLQLRIVHGKGKGVLRRTVHSILEKHEGVVDFELGGAGGGGWGATLVNLRPLE